MSGHVGEAEASSSLPQGLDARQERYWLIERRCKDLCLYLDALTRNMPRYEKYILSAKIREIGYLCLETAMAYLSHAKGTASLKHVTGVLWRGNAQLRPDIYAWVCRHRHSR